MSRVGKIVALASLLVILAENLAAAQACCAGASGLTPGWLANHERALVGAQLRMTETHGSYPTTGRFYAPPPGRDARVETSLYGSLRLVPRGQISATAPLVFTRRRANGRVEE